jgi:glycosyltransferase involved in cell wall biosynthesis
MNIAFIQSFLPSRSNGGVGHFTDQLADRLVDRGHRVTVFSLDPASEGAKYMTVNPSEAWWTRNRFGRWYGFGFWVAKQDYSQFDVVHAMGDNHLLLTRTPVLRTFSGSALGEALSARKLHTKLLFLSIYLLELVGSLRASNSVGISAATTFHFPGVHSVVPNAVDLDVFHPGERRSAQPTILAVGHRLHDRKRLDLLLEVFQQHVKSQVPGAELWLVADDAIDAPSVRCFSRLTAEELAELYRKAWLFCLPSSYEGFGRPYIEALASGTAVVATPNPGACEVLDDGRYGVLVKERELASALVGLLIDSGRREQLARRGLARARDFSWEHVTSTYEQLYEGLRPRGMRDAQVEHAG